MAGIEIVVARNQAGRLAGLLPHLITQVIHEQVDTTKTDVEDNIEKYHFIDTGQALHSVEGTMQGAASGQVAVTARSPEGFDYPALGNYGGAHVAPRPFFTEAEVKATQEYPRRMADAIEAAL